MSVKTIGKKIVSTIVTLILVSFLVFLAFTVISGDRNITLREDNLMLYNSIVQKPQEETK